MKFVIPLQRDDLLPHGGGGLGASSEYRVRSVYAVRDLKTKLNEIASGVQQQGCDLLLSDFSFFDVCFSALTHFHKDLGADVKERVFTLLETAMQDLVPKLDQALHHVGGFSSEEKSKWLNKLKMLLYLFCQMIEMLEANESAAAAGDLLVGGSKRGGGAGAKKSFSGVWEADRKSAAVTLLYRVVNLQLAPLFDPPIVEEDLVNLVACVQFRLLENPCIGQQRLKDLRGSLLQVLGVLCSRYNYALSCRLKIVQSLRHFEHLAAPLSEAVEMFAKDYACPGMVMEIVRDICQVDSQELQRDSGAARAYATFFSELSERVPEMMKPCLSLLMIHLDGESSSLRKAVLNILGQLLLTELGDAGQEHDASTRASRDQLLDCLEDHLHDVHAHVRSSVLQVWAKLCGAKAIPLNRQQRVLRLVIGRLRDKSATVRQQAVHLLTTLLQCNPYTASLPVEDFRQQLKGEEKKLEEMQQQQQHANSLPRSEQEWEESIKDELFDKLQQQESEEGGGEGKDGGGGGGFEVEEPEAVWENASRNEVISRIQHLLQKRKFSGAVSLLKSAQKTFSEDTVLLNYRREELTKAENMLTVLKAAFLFQPELGGGGGGGGGGEEPEPEDDDLNKQKLLVAYLQDSLDFAHQLNEALPTVSMLLGSKQIRDILAAVHFFVSAFEFDVPNAMYGVRQMLNLIWSRDAEVKEAVVGAYKRLYVDVGAGREGAAAGAEQIVKNLMALVTDATVGELTSLEELIGMLVTSNDIGKDCFMIMWKYFTRTNTATATSLDESRAALLLLGMVANTDPKLVTANLNVLVKTGLNERGMEDFRTVHDVCVALSKISNIKSSSVDQAALKFDRDHEIFTSLEEILVDGIDRLESNFYIPMSQRAVTVVYQLSEQPDLLAGRVCQKICHKLAAKLEEGSLDSVMLRRLVSLVGHVALCQLNYLDVSVLAELKRRKQLREIKEEKNKTRRRSSIAASARKRRSKGNGGSGSGEPPVDDLESVGAEADDAEIEFIRNVCEAEIVTASKAKDGDGDSDGESLLFLFVPLLVHICSHPDKYDDPKLMAAASLSMAKLMLVSSTFCEEQLQLLFTLMEKSKNAVIRANMIIASGDLSFRFPNILEPWTPRMYGRLRDESTLVRSNTLTVLTHLILNDMIKVKGQISDMALCIADQDEKISGLSKHFFAELARKGNALYNVMPDIISRLSDVSGGGGGGGGTEAVAAAAATDEEEFRSIMTFIIGLIEKDKHLEALVEKLCHRFRATQCDRQWRDLAFCLSRFSFSDRSIKKLQDNFSCFSDKLHDDAVHDAITGILVHAKRNIKQETKLVIEEMEEKIAKARDKCMEDHNASNRAKLAKQGKRKSTVRKKPAAKEDTSDDDEEESSGDDEEEKVAVEGKSAPTPTNSRSTRRSKSNAAAAAPDADKSDEDGNTLEEDEDEDEATNKRAKRTRKEAAETPVKSTRKTRRR